METEVEKASRRLRVVSMGIACKVAADRNITKVDIALPNIPNSPLEIFERTRGSDEVHAVAAQHVANLQGQRRLGGL